MASKRPRTEESPRRWSTIVTVGVVVWAIAILVIEMIYREPASPPGNRPIEVAAKGFVTSDTCRSCHPGNYQSWHASYHRTMTQVATSKTIIPNVEGLELEHQKTTFKFVTDGDRVSVRSRPRGAEDWSAPEDVVLLTGSHTMQLYWMETGKERTLVQFPLAYLVADDMWAPVNQTFLISPDFKELYKEGEWNWACMDCHVTQGRPRWVEGQIFDSEVTEFGISCEACHSEGADHISKNRNPLRRFTHHLTDKVDTTVANPTRMDGPASTLTCGQCHSVWAFGGAAEKSEWNEKGTSFRPGADEMGLRWIVRPGSKDHGFNKIQLTRVNPHYFTDRFWFDGMIRVTGREANGIIDSPCYEGGSFSCLSCHEMHPETSDSGELAAWASDQLKMGVAPDDNCLQCHPSIGDDISAHTRHPLGSAGSECYNCHMPHSTYGLLRAVRSHTVTSPTVAESHEVGRPNACNLCHLDKTLTWTADWLETWYEIESPTSAISEEDPEISAAVKWYLKGDAGQRALIAWSMGWEAAQEASGTDWIPPILILNLNDEYAAVRYGAWKSLKTFSGFEDFEYDFTADGSVTAPATNDAFLYWWSHIRKPSDQFQPQVILHPDGSFIQQTQIRLLQERDQTPVFLAE